MRRTSARRSRNATGNASRRGLCEITGKPSLISAKASHPHSQGTGSGHSRYGIMQNKFATWLHRTMPKREDLEANRFVAPLARRQELWRFTRRSVPRGVAIGLLVGIFALIPGVQIVGAALLCVPCRGNIPIAALMTFLSNPATTPLILAASIYLGNKLGFHADVSTFYRLYERGAGLRDWCSRRLSADA